MTIDKDTRASKPKEDPINFTELVLGFSSAALYYIGEANIEGKSVAEDNLALALQNLEIVELLANKTSGNLTPDESKMIADVIADLRKKYMDKLMQKDKK